MRTRPLAALAAVLTLGTGPAEAVDLPRADSTWARQSDVDVIPPASPAPLLAYDEAHSVVVLYLPLSDASATAQTWTWDGARWTREFPAVSPPARTGATFTYDATRNVAVLFGGASVATGTLSNQTWTWDGTNWTARTPATSPPARRHAATAYDRARGTVVLFGGYGSDGTTCCAPLGDTWTWDGVTWTKLKPAGTPSRRHGATMAPDEARNQLVLFGGADVTRTYAETWTWNGTTWAQRTTNGPSARVGAGMAYDGDRARVVMFGGVHADSSLGEDTWIWNSQWTQRTSPAHPPGRGWPALAYDAARRTVVVFGGQGGVGLTSSHLDDTWLYPRGIEEPVPPRPSAECPALIQRVDSAAVTVTMSSYDDRNGTVALCVRFDGQLTGGVNVTAVAREPGSYRPRVDNLVGQCTAAVTTNVAPGPHPLADATTPAGPYHLDVYAGREGVAVCVEIGSVQRRVVLVPAHDGTGALPRVSVRQDRPG